MVNATNDHPQRLEKDFVVITRNHFDMNSGSKCILAGRIHSCKFPAFWVGKKLPNIEIGEEIQSCAELTMRCVCINGEEFQKSGKLFVEKLALFEKKYIPLYNCIFQSLS